MVPDRGADQHGRVPAGHVALHPGRERAGVHGEVAVDLDDADGVAAQPGDADGLLHRGVGLGRHVDGGPLGLHAAAHRGAAAAAVQGGEQGDEVGAGAGVLDDAAAGGGGAEGLRQAEQLGEPVHDVLLELGGGGAGHPRHALDAEAGGDEVAEHRGPGGVGGEVAEEAGVLPVREPGDDDAVEVGEDVGEGLALLRGSGGQRGPHVARRDRRPHGEGADPRPVVGDPVDDLVAVLPELLGGHVRSRLGHPVTLGTAPNRPHEAAGYRADEPDTAVGRGSDHRTAVAVSMRAGPGGSPRIDVTQDEDAGTGAAPRGGGRSGARRVPDEPPGKGSDAAGERHVAAVVDPEDRRIQHSAPGATRTHTARVLNPLPLPIGVRGRAGRAGSRISLAGAREAADVARLGP